MEKYRIPDKVYVKFQRRERDGDQIILGFMTPYDPDDESFEDRKLTVDRWSDHRNKSILDKQAWLGFNEPMSGFKILHTVSRYRTSNKVWRVQDPRGFELEISSWNLSDLLQEVTIEKGVIQEDCVWARDSNGDNQLVPITADVYEDAKLYTEVRNNRISLRDVKRGDIVILHDGRTVEYLGGLYYLKYYNSPAQEDASFSINREYFFIVHKDDGTKELDQKSGVKVGLIVEEVDEELTKAEVTAKVHESLPDLDRFMLMARPDPFSYSDIEVSLRDYELPDTLTATARNLVKTPLLLGEYEGESLFWKSHQNWRFQNESYQHIVAVPEYLFKEGRCHLKRKVARSKRHGRKREARIPMSIEEMRDAKWKQVIFTIDGEEYTPWTPF